MIIDRKYYLDEKLWRTSKDRNIHKKLVLKAMLPVKPVQSPKAPWLLTICLAQSIGPLYWRSATFRCICICNLTTIIGTDAVIAHVFADGESAYSSSVP